MKRKLFFIVLSVALISILLFTGCATTKTNPDTTTPYEQLENRVASIESTNSTQASQLVDLKNQTDAQATIITQLQADLATVSAPDLSGYVTLAVYNALLARVEVLEATEGGEGGETPTGEVTVVLDVDEEPYLFTSTTASQVFPVKITNNTADYQKVKFNLTLQCVSSDGVADITAGPTVAVNTVGMTITYVPTQGACQLLYATWVSTDTVLVAPGKTATVYVYLTAFTTVGSEVWQATLSGIVIDEL